MKAELDAGKEPKLYDTHFARYGPGAAKWIAREPTGLRFKVPASKAEQLGLYAYFALAGDFEVSVAYQLVSMPPPQSGFGPEVGIAVDAEAAGIKLTLTRAIKPEGGSGLKVNREKGGNFKELAFQPTAAKAGVLVMRREKGEIVCLASEKPGADAAEVGRFPFTDATVRKVRLFADSGGSPTPIDARFFDFKVRAEEISGGIVQHELTGGLGWWIVAGVVGALVVGIVVYRRRGVAR
jgi:hypothetical protein